MGHIQNCTELELWEDHGFSHEDIAALKDIPVGKVKALIFSQRKAKEKQTQWLFQDSALIAMVMGMIKPRLK